MVGLPLNFLTVLTSKVPVYLYGDEPFSIRTDRWAKMSKSAVTCTLTYSDHVGPRDRVLV